MFSNPFRFSEVVTLESVFCQQLDESDWYFYQKYTYSGYKSNNNGAIPA
jgi:hypothetical protein